MEQIEPFFIRQTAEPMSDAARIKWIRARADEAAEAGGKLFRVSQHEAIHSLLIFEAWDKQVWEVGDQGEPRFKLIAGEYSVG